MLFQSQAPKSESRRGRGYATWCRAGGWNLTRQTFPNSAGQPGTRPFPSPTYSPPPTHPPSRPVGQPVSAAEPPPGGATGLAAAGCNPMERRSTDLPGSFPRCPLRQSVSPPRCSANRNPRLWRHGRGGLPAFTGTAEKAGSAGRKTNH